MSKNGNIFVPFCFGKSDLMAKTNSKFRPVKNKMIRLDSHKTEEGQIHQRHWTQVKIGEFSFSGQTIQKSKWFKFWPVDCAVAIAVPLAGEKEKGWKVVNDDMNNPTISPSINSQIYWHGYVRNGYSERL